MQTFANMCLFLLFSEQRAGAVFGMILEVSVFGMMICINIAEFRTVDESDVESVMHSREI